MDRYMCRCGAGNIVLRKSYKEHSYGQLFYSCPLSKPAKKEYGCRFFMWKEEFDNNPGYNPSQQPNFNSPGPSTPGPSTPAACTSELTECWGCQFKDLQISMLETRIKMLETKLELATNPENHACMSGALLNELLDSVGNLSVG